MAFDADLERLIAANLCLRPDFTERLGEELAGVGEALHLGRDGHRRNKEGDDAEQDEEEANDAHGSWRRLRRNPGAGRRGGRGAALSLARCRGSVSYTHLTLPT